MDRRRREPALPSSTRKGHPVLKLPSSGFWLSAPSSPCCLPIPGSGGMEQNAKLWGTSSLFSGEGAATLLRQVWLAFTQEVHGLRKPNLAAPMLMGREGQTLSTSPTSSLLMNHTLLPALTWKALHWLFCLANTYPTF